MQAYYLPSFCSMSVWQTETKAISRQKKLCGQGCSSNLKKDQSFPGQCIAVDHYICSTKGRLFTSRGNPNDTDMYTGGALFVDMNSKQVENVFQQHLNTHETLKAKQDLELSLWSTSLTMIQPSPPSPMLPISPIALKFNLLLELEHITTMELQRRPSRISSCLLQEP